MEQLGRYPLSVILSYLTETDGVSLLRTNKRYASQLLPIFRLPLMVVSNSPRYRFVVVPVQDPVVLLERLNTRRLCRRRRNFTPGRTTAELAWREWHEKQLSIPPELELLRFLDANDFLRGPTLLVSYPRSGNTLVRTLLERTTGVVTGSDTRPDRSLSRELAEQHGLIGEGVTQSVEFIKTHWPERTGNQVFSGKRAILVVRNPYDAIDSYWNMNATKSHTKSLACEVYERFRDKWEGLVKNEISIWIKFLDYWLKQNSVPVLVVRFEDLVQDPARQLCRMMEFALQKKLTCFWRERIRHATTSSSTETLGSYRPRTALKGVVSIGKSITKGHYSEELLDYIQQTSAGHSENYLQHFGYEIKQGFPGNYLEARIPAIADTSDRDCDGTIRVNFGVPVRPIDCPYGRLMQKWRHSVTKSDQDPLPTA